MHTLFYSNISEFSGNLEGMLDEVTYKTTIHNMHKLVWKAQCFKSADVSMLDHGCGVSQYPQFYDTNKKIKYHHIHMWEVIQVKRVTNFFTNHGFFALAKPVETFIMISISDMLTIKYWQNLGIIMDKAKRKYRNNEKLVIHVSRHLQRLEVIYSQDFRRILIMYTDTVKIFCR